MFQRFKSLAQLGHLPKHNDDRQAWLCGKLLVALLVEKLIRHALGISPSGYDLVAPRSHSAWRDFQFVLHQVKRAIEPAIPPGRVLSEWHEISRRWPNHLVNG